MTKPMLALGYIWGVLFKGVIILLGLFLILFCCYKRTVPTSICIISSIGLIACYVYLIVQETIWLCELWKEVNPKTHKLEIK